MFWRFGFHNASAIDSLLDKEDVQLEAILDEDDLLQECKSQNARLIDYFGRLDVLQKLFGFVTGSIETEEKGRFKYPYVATEALCSDIWSIVDTCINQQHHLLVPFWETVLEKTPVEMKTQTIMISHFTKITSIFLSKRPEEMFAFIRSQPNITERLLIHIEAAPIVDLIIRIVQLDEQIPDAGVLEWLSSENIMSRLLALLSPAHSPDIHIVVSDLIKSIISMATPSPAAAAASEFGAAGAASGAHGGGDSGRMGNGDDFGPTTGGAVQSGSASNRFARELAKRENVEALVGYILTEFQVPPLSPLEVTAVGVSMEEKEAEAKDAERKEEEEDIDPSLETLPLPNFDSQVSSVIQSICMIIELIRKNNSDFFEPYLFHTLRNRLIHIQQQQQQQQQKQRQHQYYLDEGGTGGVGGGEMNEAERQREVLESAMREMVDEMGVVHLGPVLEVLIPRLELLVGYLRRPRSLRGPMQTTIGSITPLTFERYRIAELFAELLHCSNMSLLNRPPGDVSDQLYDSEGRLQGGLRGLEELAQVISMSNSGSGDTYKDREREESGDEMMLDSDGDEDEGVYEREPLPVSKHPRVPAEVEVGLDSDDDDDGSMSGEDVDDHMMLEEICIHDEPIAGSASGSGSPGTSSPSVLARVAVGGGGGHRREAAGEGEPLKLMMGSPLAVTASPLPVSPSSRPSLSPLQSSPSASSSASTRSRGSQSESGGSNTPDAPSRKNSNRSMRSTRSRRSAGGGNGRGNEGEKQREIPVGERLKKEYLDVGVLGTLLDLFFEFPWNNFLHSAVYDVVHQILTGRVDGGLNRELAVALFRDARLMHRIVDGSRRSDEAVSKPNGVRLGYMGHLTLMSEDVILALARFPPELRLHLIQYAPTPGWDEYVTGRYDETKRKDTKVLGGGRPPAAGSAGKGVTRWKVDEGDDSGVAARRVGAGGGGVGEVKGEFKRGIGSVPRQTADFGPPPGRSEGEKEQEDESQPAPQFARYLAQEIHSRSSAGSSIPGSSDDDEDEDSEEEMEGGWLSQSRFDLAPPPLAATRRRSMEADRRPLELDTSSHGFDDSFGEPTSSFDQRRLFSQDPFSPNMDDDFVPFSDPRAIPNNTSDPFGVSSASNSFSDDSFDSNFGDFGDFQSSSADFGDFHAAGFGSPEHEDGELTPTGTGSWTFASASTSDSGFSENGVF